MYYLYGVDGIAGFRYNNTTYLFRKNIQGDVTHIYTESGTLVGQYAYDAWGNCAILQDTNGIATLNPFRYRGYYYDTETNLYYLQSRYYDPETCRFVNADDISYLDPETIGGLNLYAYCGNNPVMGVDPEGTAWWEWLIIGALVAFAIAAVVLIDVATAGIVGKLIVAASAGYLTGVAINITDQLDKNRYDITKIDPGQVLSSGLWSAFGSVVAYCVGTIAAGMIGSFAGEFTTNLFKIATRDQALISSISGTATLLGKTMGMVGASLFSSYLVNEALSKKQSFGEMIKDEVMNNILEFVKNKLKELAR